MENASQDGVLMTGTEAVQDVQVDAVMANIRRRVAEKRAAGVYGPAEWPRAQGLQVPHDSTDQGDLSEHLDAMAASARCDVNGEAISSHRKLTGAAIVHAKRLTRFLVRRYTDGLFLRQSYFNHETTEAMRLMHARIDALEQELAALRADKNKPGV